MICVFSFCSEDREMAVELARHIECLGGVKSHRCLILCPANVDWREVERLLHSSFSTLEVVTYAPRLKGWPDGPNQAFFAAAEAVFKRFPKECWLWLEADCVPIRQQWLDHIGNEYRFCGKTILGAIENAFDAASKPNGEHVTGVAVYPGDFIAKCAPLRTIITATEHYRKSGALPPAFDVYLAPYTLPNVARTQTIRHYWKSDQFTEAKNGKVYCRFKLPYGASNVVDMDAALIHGCKDMSLLDIVQKRLVHA